MKVLAILYHKNILSIYQKEWIEDCINSLKNQTFQDFTIYELNYGSDKLNLCQEYNVKNDFRYFKKKFDNHGDAINFLFMNAIKDGFDVVFNNNIDDYSHHKRFETQLQQMKNGYDIVSSNFQIINEIGELGQKMNLSNFDIKQELLNNHNVICHPGVCYSRNFIRKNLYDGEEIPKEDLLLWKRTVSNFIFYICEETLIYYRKHKNQITTKNLSKIRDRQEEEEAEILMAQLNIVLDKKNKTKSIEQEKNNSKFEITFDYIPTINRDLCRKCGEPKNRVKFNYCQKCNSLY